MARSQPTAASSDTVRVARIGALQAVVVATIAALAGIVGTVGLKYWEGNQEIKEAKAEAARIKEEAQGKIAELQQRMRYVESQTVPMVVLITGKTSLTQETCLSRLMTSMERHLPNASGLGSAGRVQDGVGSSVDRGGNEARIVCEQPDGRLILVVAGVAGLPSADVGALAAKLMADLQ